MAGIINFETFFITGLLLNLTPGNDTFFILSRSLSDGKKAGLISALGIGAGSVGHTFLTALGLSAIIAGSPVLYLFIKWAGAAYLMYLGIQMFLKKNSSMETGGESLKSVKYSSHFRSAMLTNLLNHKVAVFYLAFLPQFIDVNQGSSITPLIILGLTFTITGTLWCCCLALFASSLVRRIQHKSRAEIWLNRLAGSVFILLGLKLILDHEPLNVNTSAG
jgi:threonine/homoserine/homoserine lactone efflux protein